MLYSQADKDAAATKAHRRAWVVWLPTAAFVALAIATFILYRSRHDESGWILSALFTILGGGYCIFFYGVYLGPVLKYKKHIGYMLDGRRRATEGYLKEISDAVLDRDGVDCYSVIINIGEKDDPEDDRQFYLDAFKSMAGYHAGDHVRIQSNDRMIMGIEKVTVKSA